MRELLPDVLHNAGLTPHEVGWLQLHAEPVLRAEDGRAVAELWLQAAFEPTGAGRVELLDAGTGQAVGEVPLPAVARGAAVRWRIPLHLPEGTRSLRFRVEAPVPEEAERVRAPWKLLDTIELVAPPDEEGPSGLGVAARVGAVALGGVAGALLAAAANPPTPPRRPSGMKIHPARARPRELASDVLPAGAEESFSAAIETLWQPGDPLDSGALRQRLHAHRPSGPTCPACGAELVPGGEFCPRCLGPVAAVASEALLRARAEEGSAAPPVAQEPVQEEAARCALHPERPSTGSCDRCGAFFCEQCETSGLCPSCEARRNNPEVVKKAGYALAATVHELAAFVLLVRSAATLVRWADRSSMLEALALAFAGALLPFIRQRAAFLIAATIDLVLAAAAIIDADFLLFFMAAVAMALSAGLWRRMAQPQ